MARTVIIHERCKGCLLCSVVCPKEIIAVSTVRNAQGYAVAHVTDMDACTGCGSCALICPDMAIRVFTEIKQTGERGRP